MIRVAICDDDPSALAALEDLVRQQMGDFAWQLHTFSSCQAFQAVQQPADLLFMDIDLGDGSGIDLARQFRARYPDAAVIFVTSHLEYVEDSFAADPQYFLVKPIRPDSFRRAMERAMARLAASQRHVKLTVTFQNRVCAVELDQIRYIEFSVRCATIHAGQRQLRAYEKLSALLQRLDQRFIQCHKSYVVNMDYAISLRGGVLELDDGTQIPVSQSRFRVTREALLRHLTGGSL